MREVRRLLVHSACAITLFAAAQTILHAQYQKFEGLVVRNIQFSPKEQPLEPEELHNILPLHMNEALHMAVVRSSIERLFATGRYADIQVEAQPYRDGVAITFVTKNSWFIGGVSAGGRIASPPNPGQIENSGDLPLGQPYTEARLNKGLENQQRLLTNNGLFHGDIHPVFDWESGRSYQQVNIRFDVDSGRRAHFGTPVFTGDLKIDQRRLLTATKFRRWVIHTWKPMTQTRLRQGVEGVRALYQKDNRLEAKVTLESVRYDEPSNSAIPTLHVEAGPRIEVHIVGAKVSEKRLQRYIPVFEEHAVDHDLLVEGAHNLRDYFQGHGYFEAEVVFKEQNVVNDKANIDYLVNTGKPHRLVKIEIAGNHYFRTESIRERMFLQTATFLQFPHGRYSENLLRRDEESIHNLYESNGFRDVKTTHRLEDDYQGKVGDIAVFIDIQEGTQYFVRSLQVTGIEHLDQKAIVEKLSSAPGQPFSEFNVAVDRDGILAQYFEKGFPNPTFEWSSKPAAEPHQVDLQYVIREGPQQFVRQVIITGNHITRTQLINRNITLNPGDPLSPTQMTDIQRRLYGLGVFARVDAAIQDPDGETDSKYVLYNVEEARRYSLAVGVGAELGKIGGCQNCFEASAGATGFSPRVSLDVTRNNLWGLTHSLSLRTRASTLDQRALLNYSWPQFDHNEKLTVSFTGLYEQSRDIRTFSFRREEGSAQLTQRLTKATTLFYRLAYRRVSVSDLKIDQLLVPTLSQPVRVGISSINVVQDRRDDPVDPHKGIYNTLDLGLAGHYLGSQVTFLRVLARNASYYSIGKRLVLARSTEFGEIYPFRSTGGTLDAIPLPERFFGGGGTSHRGFPEYQAGPRDTSTGFPLGGTAVLFNQTELRFPLIGDNLGGVLYHDMGNVYSSLENLSFRFRQKDLQDFDYTVHGVGFGFRYRTPVGPVRLDLGYSLNPPSYFGFNPKGTQQDLINAGPTPCSPPPGIPNQCERQTVGHFRFFISIGQTF